MSRTQCFKNDVTVPSNSHQLLKCDTELVKDVKTDS
jgi:hypothetical protein